MKNGARAGLVVGVVFLACAPREGLHAQTPSAQGGTSDAIAQAQTQRAVGGNRPEQRKTPHDQSNIFGSGVAQPTSSALKGQVHQGQYPGFDLYRDPIGATRPGESVEAMV